MIHVIATIEIVEGKRADYLAAFHELVPLVLAEQGLHRIWPGNRRRHAYPRSVSAAKQHGHCDRKMGEYRSARGASSRQAHARKP